MRNRITTIIILVSIILLAIATIHGIDIWKLQILSVSQIKQKNNELSEKINEASTLTSIDYPDNIETLEETYDKYTIQKQKYEELSEFNNENSEDIYEKKQYDISYLWKIFGEYVKTRNLNLGVNVEKTTGQDLYNLNFTVSGEYVNISQFIAELENNSDLYFRIYDFKMSGSGQGVTSTFTVKNIRIDPSTITNASTIATSN